MLQLTVAVSVNATYASNLLADPTNDFATSMPYTPRFPPDPIDPMATIATSTTSFSDNLTTPTTANTTSTASLPYNPPSHIAANPASAPYLPITCPTATTATPAPTSHRYPANHITSTTSLPANPFTAKVDSSLTESASKPPMVHTPKTVPYTVPLPHSILMDPRPVKTTPPMSSPANFLVETGPTRNVLYDPHDATKPVQSIRRKEESTGAPQSDPPPLIPKYDTTIEDIVQTVERSVHQSEAESFILTKLI